MLAQPSWGSLEIFPCTIKPGSNLFGLQMALFLSMGVLWYGHAKSGIFSSATREVLFELLCVTVCIPLPLSNYPDPASYNHICQENKELSL